MPNRPATLLRCPAPRAKSRAGDRSTKASLSRAVAWADPPQWCRSSRLPRSPRRRPTNARPAITWRGSAATGVGTRTAATSSGSAASGALSLRGAPGFPATGPKPPTAGAGCPACGRCRPRPRCRMCPSHPRLSIAARPCHPPRWVLAMCRELGSPTSRAGCGSRATTPPRATDSSTPRLATSGPRAATSSPPVSGIDRSTLAACCSPRCTSVPTSRPPPAGPTNPASPSISAERSARCGSAPVPAPTPSATITPRATPAPATRAGSATARAREIRSTATTRTRTGTIRPGAGASSIPTTAAFAGRSPPPRPPSPVRAESGTPHFGPSPRCRAIATLRSAWPT